MRLSYTDAQTVIPLAKWALENGIKRAYAIFLDYGPGIDGGAAFEKAFTAGGGTIVGESRVPLTNMDYSAYVQRIKDAKPDAIMAIVSAGGGGRAFLKAYSDAGLDKAGVKVLASSGLTIENQLPALGPTCRSACTQQPTMRSSARRPRTAKRSHDHGSCRVTARFRRDRVLRCRPCDLRRRARRSTGNLDPEKSLDLLRHTKFMSPRGPVAVDPATRDIVQNIYIVRAERKGDKDVNTLIANLSGGQAIESPPDPGLEFIFEARGETVRPG